MKFDTHETDLYVLPETTRERHNLQSYCETKKLAYKWSYSNIEGNSWYGKQFIDISFCSHLKNEIEEYIN